MSDRWDDVPRRSPPDDWEERRVSRLEDDVAGLRERLQERHGPSQRYQDLVEEKRRLQAELAQLQRQAVLLEFEADRERRAMAAEVRRLHRQVERAAERRQRPTGRRATRSAHLVVDPNAWTVLNRAALEGNRTLAGLVTELIVDELSLADESRTRMSPAGRRRRSPGEGPPRPEPRVVRLDCDDDAWQRIRLLADDVGLPLGRYLGEIAEAAAFMRG